MLIWFEWPNLATVMIFIVKYNGLSRYEGGGMGVGKTSS